MLAAGFIATDSPSTAEPAARADQLAAAMPSTTKSDADASFRPTTDPEEKSAIRRAAGAVLTVGRDVMTDVMAAVIARQIGA